MKNHRLITSFFNVFGRKFFFPVAIVLLFAASCAKQDRENTMISQESSIDSYISSSLSNYQTVRKGGSNRIIIEEGASSPGVLGTGDSLYFYYAGYVFSRGKGALFTTNYPKLAKEKGFNTDTTVMKIRYGADDLISGLKNGLDGVREKEHSYIIFSAKYGYGNSAVYNIDKLSPLFFEVWIEKIIKNE
ncbi:MAG: FKBP-type peptidyl-prolyl cis-trans isomerase [Bacteroidales bacterium]|jgi:hypothetical protein|nr:FKBP-type peptidyl-prolyl cis-trans isomerase [Bacteroidales bacterium]